MESAFLRELPEEDVERQDLRPGWLDGSDGDGGGDDDAVDAPWVDEFEPARPRGLGAQFPVGCLVRHPLFGVGTVQAILPRGSVTSARVAFRTVGVKTLVLEYAKLQRV
jgi:DNA helicase-2/ATP-dependent DNA helicase PcrA